MFPLFTFGDYVLWYFFAVGLCPGRFCPVRFCPAGFAPVLENLKSPGIFVEVLESPGIWTYKEFSHCTSSEIWVNLCALKVREFIEKVLEFDIGRSWKVLEMCMNPVPDSLGISVDPSLGLLFAT